MARTVGSSGPETRQRILDAAAELFAEHGFAGATLNELAGRLGISKAALYYHFASKEDLLDGLVQPVAQAQNAFVEAAERGEYSTEQFLRRYLDQMSANAFGVYPFMVDPGARVAIRQRHNQRDVTHRIEQALARQVGGAPDDVRAQFALGGIRAVLLARVAAAVPWEKEATAPARATLLSGEEREALLAAALAVLAASPESVI